MFVNNSQNKKFYKDQLMFSKKKTLRVRSRPPPSIFWFLQNGELEHSKTNSSIYEHFKNIGYKSGNNSLRYYTQTERQTKAGKTPVFTYNWTHTFN